MRFIATINVPGYLPMSDEVDGFDTAREAWQFLADERTRGEDDAYDDGDDEGYSATKNILETLGTGTSSGTQSDYENAGLDPVSGAGTVYGPTPGYDGEHDLGLAYTVTAVATSRFIITVERTESITFAMQATDAEDAESRYGMEGDELDSKLTASKVVSVDEVTE